MLYPVPVSSFILPRVLENGQSSARNMTLKEKTNAVGPDFTKALRYHKIILLHDSTGVRNQHATTAGVIWNDYHTK